jgi:type IV pilus assembly protein PilQ
MLAMESRVDEAIAQQLTSANPQSISRIKDVRLVPNGNRMKLEIDTVGGTRPQVFFTQQGQSWIGDITNAQLDMGQGAYRQESPLPGVSFIEAKQVGSDSVRVQIAGTSAAPQGLLAQRSPTQLVFDFEGLPSAQVATVPGQPTLPIMQPPQAPVPQQAAPAPQPIAQNPAQPSPQTVPVAPAPQMISQVPAVGQLNQPQLPPGALPNGSQFQGRAIAPPSGDIAVGTILPDSPTVDLGSNATITLTLKDAPVGDVLSLLVRRAGLNVVLNDVPPDLTISLDVNESPLQETFNFILRLKELQAQRREQTVFIGTNLPGVDQRIVRTFRLNQVVLDATKQDTTTSTAEGAGNASVTVQRVREESTIVASLERLAGTGGPLEGVTFIPDVRTNSITATGTAAQLDLVAAYIAQLDIRTRQVLLNVRLIDVQITGNSSLGVDLGSASGNFALGTGSETAGSFGGAPLDQPSGSSVPNVGPGAPIGSTDLGGGGTFVFNTLNRLQQSLAVRLEAAISDGTAKVLADPKLVVTEGGASALSIGQDVIVNVQSFTDPATGVTTVSFVRDTAGVTIGVGSVRIDDNGFITLDLQPTVSSPADTVAAGGTTLTLLNRRALQATRIRVRDGQTFVLSGLIQDTDRVDVRKVPLLADIPLLGSLFRRQTTSNVRTEVVLMLTPYILRDDVAYGLPQVP